MRIGYKIAAAAALAVTILPVAAQARYYGYNDSRHYEGAGYDRGYNAYHDRGGYRHDWREHRRYEQRRARQARRYHHHSEWRGHHDRNDYR